MSDEPYFFLETFPYLAQSNRLSGVKYLFFRYL